MTNVYQLWNLVAGYKGESCKILSTSLYFRVFFFFYNKKIEGKVALRKIKGLL